MGNNILAFKGNDLIFVSNNRMEVDERVKISITFPRQLSVDGIVVQGVVSKQVVVHIDRLEYHVARITVSHLSLAKKKILNAYVTYLDQDRNLNEIFRQFRLMKIRNSVEEPGEIAVDDNSTKEYLLAILADVTFN